MKQRFRVQFFTGKIIPQVIQTKVEETTYNHEGVPSVKTTTYWRDATVADLPLLKGQYRSQWLTGKLVLREPRIIAQDDDNAVPSMRGSTYFVDADVSYLKGVE